MMTLDTIKKAMTTTAFLTVAEVREYLINLGVTEWFTVNICDDNEDVMLVTFLTLGVLELNRLAVYYTVA